MAFKKKINTKIDVLQYSRNNYTERNVYKIQRQLQYLY